MHTFSRKLLLVFMSLLFSIPTYSDVPATTGDDIVLNANDLTPAYQQTIPQFKTWFNIEISPADAKTVHDVVKKLRSDFYKKLTSCTPGTYKYPIDNMGWGKQKDNSYIPLYSLGTTTITGIKDGKCIVDTNRENGSSMSASFTNTSTKPATEVSVKIIPMSHSHCEYSANSLTFFTDANAESYSGRATIINPEEFNMNITTVGANNSEEIEKINKQECTFKIAN